MSVVDIHNKILHLALSRWQKVGGTDGRMLVEGMLLNFHLYLEALVPLLHPLSGLQAIALKFEIDSIFIYILIAQVL